MSTLVLVRHGQASFLADDYDVLSPLGEAQARQLGAYWARIGLVVDEVWIGPRVRQVRTAALAGEAFRAAGGAWPEARALAALDEYHAEHVVKHALTDLALRDDAIRELALAYAQARLGHDRKARFRSFERLFQAVTRRWVAGELIVPGVETWAEFSARVHDAVRVLTAGAGSRTVLAFTSAGTIGVGLQAVLGVPAEAALELGWVVRNASLSELLFSSGRVTLSSFNALPHLPDPAHWTFR